MTNKALGYFVSGLIIGLALGFTLKYLLPSQQKSELRPDQFLRDFSQLYLKYHSDPNTLFAERLQEAMAPELKAVFAENRIASSQLWQDADILKIAGADPYFVYFQKNGSPFMKATLQIENTGNGYKASHLISQEHTEKNFLKLQPQKNWQLQVPCALSPNDFKISGFNIKPHPFVDNLFELVLVSTDQEHGEIEFQCLQTVFKIPWQKAHTTDEVDLYLKVPASWGKTLLHPGSNSPSQKKTNLESELGLQLKETR